MKWLSLEGIRTETKRIRWPKGEEFKVSILDVLVFTILMGVFFVACDSLVAAFLRFIGA